MNIVKSIDLNCDLGEGMPNDEALMPYISSANIACGYHAGNEDTMKRTIELCLQHKVAIGAHPGFRDKENFGRKEINLTDTQLYDLVVEQVHIVKALCKLMEATLHHVKLHGALYNMTAKNPHMSKIVAKAIKDIEPTLMVYGLSGSCTIKEAAALHLSIANEVFADRTYQDDATLTSRTHPQALITNEYASLKQVRDMVLTKKIFALSGKEIALEADTICLHGDGAHALPFAQRINQFLKSNSILIQAPPL